MRKLLLSAIVAATVAAAVPANARAGGTGLGVIVGEPTGLSLKTWLDGRHAVDAAVGWSLAANATLHVHADYLWHDFELLGARGITGRLPLYVGVGGLLVLRDDEEGPNRHEHDDRLGVRFPLGISWIASSAPVDVFAEIAPALDLIPGTDLSVNAAIGVRYWLR